jgi:putative thioredoxin
MVNEPGLSPALHGAVDLSGLVRKSQAPAGQPASSEGVVREVDDTTISALIELSKTVPVVLEIYGGQLTPQLGPLIETYDGAVVLGTVRGEQAPELIKALNVEGIPTVFAIVGGQPVPLFQGIPPEQEIKAVLDQVLSLAAKNGVTGRVATAEVTEEPAEPPLPPLHQEAYDALNNDDVAGAIAAFEKALVQNPSDADAEAGLAQVQLIQRVQGLIPEEVRQAAAAHPDSVDSALAVADLDMTGGHVEDALNRLLALFASVDEDAKELVRTRLVSYFMIAGNHTEVVGKARRALTSLMF